MTKKVKISAINFNRTTMKETIEMLIHNVEEQNKTFVVTANPEIVMYAKRNPDYLQTLQTADYIVPDGIGIILGAKILNNPLPERISGIDLMCELLKIANRKKLSVFFLGAKENVIEKMILNVKKDYPHLHISGYHHGYFEENDPKIVQMIQRANPDLTFVALGYPKQENWISKHFHLFDKGVFMGVGGSFDVLSGTVKRAPVIWRQLNLEWLYRLMKQPSRWERMTFLPLFIVEIYQEKRLAIRQNQMLELDFPPTLYKRIQRLYNSRIK